MSTQRNCNLSGCSFAEDGICLEGYADPADCPNIEENGVDTESSGAEAESSVDGVERGEVAIHSGDALSITECSPVLRRDRTSVVLVAGPNDSGKTTLAAALYEHFLHADRGPCAFAGSDTLYGFEQRCFLARVRSGRAHPDTRRTPIDAEDVGLHLRYRRVDAQECASLLVIDLAGEAFRTMRQSAEDVRSRRWLMRVDRFVFVVDMARWIEPTTRHSLKHEIVQLARRYREEGVVRETAEVDIVATKWDCVTDADGGAAWSFLEDLAAEMSTTLKQPAITTRVFATAAQPRYESKLESRYGVTELLKLWTAPRPSYEGLGWCPAGAEAPVGEFDRCGFLWPSGRI